MRPPSDWSSFGRRSVVVFVQHGAPRVDPNYVGAISLWIGMAVSVVLGHRIGLEVDDPAFIGRVALGCVVSGLLVLAGLGLRRPRSPGGVRGGVRAGTIFAVALVSLGHGVGVGREQQSARWPAVRSSDPHAVVELEVLGASMPGPRCEVRTRPAGSRIRARTRLPPELCPLATGQRIRVRATDLRWSDTPTRPGGPAPRDLAHWDGAHLAIDVERGWPSPTEGDEGWTWSGAVAALRTHAYDDARGRDDVAFVVASALGIRSALSPSRRRQLRSTGLGHLIAVSGLHVALAAWLVFHGFLRIAGGGAHAPGFAVVASCIPIVLYAGLTGGSAPAIRAAAMLVVFGWGELLGRPAHGLTLLLAVGAGMLWVHPAWATHPGFQLSMVAMVALVRSPSGLGALAATWRVSWALLPLSILYFGQTQAYGLLANAIALPVFTSWVLPWGLLGACAHPWIGAPAWTPAAWGAQLIVDVAALADALPRVSVRAMAGVSAAFLVLESVASSRRHHRRWDVVRQWGQRGGFPPTLACVGVIAVAGWFELRPTPRPAPWYATGSSRHRVTVVQAPEGFCIVNPDSAAERWSAVLGDLGAQPVVGILDAPGVEAVGPHVDALRAALERNGQWRPRASETCEMPDANRVADAWLRCAEMVGNGPVWVAGSDSPERSHCWSDGRWRLMR